MVARECDYDGNRGRDRVSVCVCVRDREICVCKLLQCDDTGEGAVTMKTHCENGRHTLMN